MTNEKRHGGHSGAESSKKDDTTQSSGTCGQWYAAASAILEGLAKTLEPFTADDLEAKLNGWRPCKPQHVGTLFAVAHRQGLIEKIETTNSGRRHRNSGLQWRWRGRREWWEAAA